MSRRAPNLSAERGNRLGIGIFRFLLDHGGSGLARLLAWVVTWCYAHFDREAFAAAETYLKLRFPEDAASCRALKKHFHCQLRELAAALIYAYRAGSGNSTPIEEIGVENLPEHGGVVIVLAHYGCWQSSMRLLARKNDRRINIMARPDHNANLDKFLALGEERNFSTISTEGFSGGLVEASAALERGEAVIIMGDRPVERTATAEAPYLGGRIELPLSPWMLAARNNVPAVPVFTELASDPPRVIVRYLPPVTFPVSEGRVSAETLRPGVERYARALEEAAMRSPYSVFRFDREKDLESANP